MAARTRWLVAAGGVAVAVGLVVAVTAFTGSGDDASGSEPAGPRRTTEVRTRDLVAHETFDGTLGYGDESVITVGAGASASDSAGSDTPAGPSGASGDAGDDGSGAGVVTAVAAAGTIVDRGGELFRIDDEPTVLLVGTLPMYRTLSTAAADGPDVQQLEENLVALGYDPGSVDAHYSGATARAVAAWEDDLGRGTVDGIVAPSEVAVRSGPVRVTGAEAAVGASASSGTAVLTVTGTTRLVTVDLPVDQQDRLQVGDAVRVELPSGGSVDGVVLSVAAVATSDDDSSSGAPGEPASEPTLATVIALAAGADAGSLDEAPVDVVVDKKLAEGALSVPVTALLALAEGGYGLEVVERGTTRFVAVDVGAFADGFVEVSGEGIRAGTTVVTA
jgi:hypothetical protein